MRSSEIPGFYGAQHCDFCAGWAITQCDGDLGGGVACRKWICRMHTRAQAITDPLKRFGREALPQSDVSYVTRDLCPDCLRHRRKVISE